MLNQIEVSYPISNISNATKIKKMPPQEIDKAEKIARFA